MRWSRIAPRIHSGSSAVEHASTTNARSRRRYGGCLHDGEDTAGERRRRDVDVDLKVVVGMEVAQGDVLGQFRRLRARSDGATHEPPAFHHARDELEKENSAMAAKMKKLQGVVDAINEKKTKAEDKIRSELHAKTQAKATAEAERLAKLAAREGVDADNVIEAAGRSGEGVDADDVIAAANGADSSDEETGVDAEDIEAALAP